MLQRNIILAKRLSSLNMSEIVDDAKWWIFHRDLAWVVTVISVSDSMLAIVTNLLNV